MFRWRVQAGADTRATTQAVWDLWAEVGSWPQWDESLEWCKLSGPFAQGSKGELKPKKWPVSHFVIVSAREGREFSNVCRMPFTQMTFHHTVSPLDQSTTRIVHVAEVKGLLAPLLWFFMRKQLQRGLPRAVQKLARLAEAKGQSQRG